MAPTLKKRLGLICARGGSKGLPGKNIADLGGKPLIAWTVEAGLSSTALDRVVLSTDDVAIADAARAAGCDVPFMRPDKLATDNATAIDVVLHALDTLEEDFDELVLLQPTSPFRKWQSIDAGIELLEQSGADSCVGICESAKAPEWMFRKSQDNWLEPVFPQAKNRDARRQDQQAAFDLNGAFYAISTAILREQRSFVGLKTVGLVMSKHESVDIDTIDDLEYARFLLQRS